MKRLFILFFLLLVTSVVAFAPIKVSLDRRNAHARATTSVVSGLHASIDPVNNEDEDSFFTNNDDGNFLCNFIPPALGVGGFLSFDVLHNLLPSEGGWFDGISVPLSVLFATLVTTTIQTLYQNKLSLSTNIAECMELEKSLSLLIQAFPTRFQRKAQTLVEKGDYTGFQKMLNTMTTDNSVPSPLVQQAHDYSTKIASLTTQTTVLENTGLSPLVSASTTSLGGLVLLQILEHCNNGILWGIAVATLTSLGIVVNDLQSPNSNVSEMPKVMSNDYALSESRDVPMPSKEITTTKTRPPETKQVEKKKFTSPTTVTADSWARNETESLSKEEDDDDGLFGALGGAASEIFQTILNKSEEESVEINKEIVKKQETSKEKESTKETSKPVSRKTVASATASSPPKAKVKESKPLPKTTFATTTSKSSSTVDKVSSPSKPTVSKETVKKVETRKAATTLSASTAGKVKDDTTTRKSAVKDVPKKDSSATVPSTPKKTVSEKPSSTVTSAAPSSSKSSAATKEPATTTASTVPAAPPTPSVPSWQSKITETFDSTRTKPSSEPVPLKVDGPSRGAATLRERKASVPAPPPVSIPESSAPSSAQTVESTQPEPATSVPASPAESSVPDTTVESLSSSAPVPVERPPPVAVGSTASTIASSESPSVEPVVPSTDDLPTTEAPGPGSASDRLSELSAGFSAETTKPLAASSVPATPPAPRSFSSPVSMGTTISAPLKRREAPPPPPAPVIPSYESGVAEPAPSTPESFTAAPPSPEPVVPANVVPMPGFGRRASNRPSGFSSVGETIPAPPPASIPAPPPVPVSPVGASAGEQSAPDTSASTSYRENANEDGASSDWIKSRESTSPIPAATVPMPGAAPPAPRPAVAMDTPKPAPVPVPSPLQEESVAEGEKTEEGVAENLKPQPPDKSTFTEEMPIRMPIMGKYNIKVVKWYKNEGDLVEFNDLLCDIETEDFTFGMVNEEESPALMGEVAIPEGKQLYEGDLLCTLFHPKKERAKAMAAKFAEAAAAPAPAEPAPLSPSGFPTAVAESFANRPVGDATIQAPPRSLPAPPPPPPPMPVTPAQSFGMATVSAPAANGFARTPPPAPAANVVPPPPPPVPAANVVPPPPPPPPAAPVPWTAFSDTTSTAGFSAKAAAPPPAPVPSTTFSDTASTAGSSATTAAPASESSVPAGGDYLSALSGGPAKKMPPKSKPKTFTTGMGYLENLQASGPAAYSDIPPPAATEMASSSSAAEPAAAEEPAVVIDKSKFTEPVLFRMPVMGKTQAKVIRWYKKEGDLVEYNDLLCDIETEDFTFGMVNEEEVDALMGEIAVAENSDPIADGALLCTLFHPKE